MNVILGALNGMLQYGRGKETGGFGILGIILAIVAVYQWDHILPFLRKIGVVGFFDKIGLIYENDPGTTGLAVFLFILEICIVLAIVIFAVLVIGIMVTIFCSSKVGTIIIVTLLAPFILVGFLTFFLIYAILQSLGIKSKKQKLREAEDKWYMENYGMKSPETIAEEELNMTPLEVLKRYCEEFDYNQAIEFLNKLPMYGDTRFLLGESNTGEIFLLLPDPSLKYCTMNPWLPDEFTVIKLDIQKFIDDIGKFQKIDHRMGGRKLIITLMHSVEENHNQSQFQDYKLIDFKDQTDIIKFYLPDYELKDFKNYLSPVGERREYTEQAERTQEYYFKTKEKLLTAISNATDKYEFDQKVSYVKALNATNEDVIRIMRESLAKVDTNERSESV